MKRAFGIRIAPCRFRQDNRDYYIDHGENTISDALTSIKHIGKRVAQALYRMRNNQYAYFIDLLYDMTMNPAFDSRAIDILIRLDYFRSCRKRSSNSGWIISGNSEPPENYLLSIRSFRKAKTASQKRMCCPPRKSVFVPCACWNRKFQKKSCFCQAFCALKRNTWARR